METWRSACEIADLVRAKKLSPVEATEATLARIDTLNPTLNAFCLSPPSKPAPPRARPRSR